MTIRNRMPQNRPPVGERGSALIEFLLCMTLLIVPLLLGTTVLGLNLIREIQVTEVCRDATHMYSQGVDFTEASYQSELFKIAQGLNISASGGNGVIILSTITYIDSNACTAGGYTSSNCTNLNQNVFTRQVVIGNSSLRASAFGTPPVDATNSDNVTQANYLTNATARANFSVIPLSAGQYAYVGETYFTTPDLSWWGPLGTTGISARFVF
ncbi:MAG TPA: hypothetical protein VHU83_05425 [Bryobacteraceae bacterium]|nr:hypothetical protein [Bryobacteraceae bacterium]